MSYAPFFTRVLCSIIVLSFFIQPVSVMAQESEAPVVTEATQPDKSAEAPSILPIGEGGDMSMAAMAGGSDSGSESKGLSSSKSYSSDQALISPFDGSLNLTYPIFVPPGRNGMQPDVSLKYNSALTEHEWFGYGWSTNIPSIRRLNKSGSEKLYVSASSTFYSSLTGELTQIGSTNEYQARVETGDFLKHVFSNNTWIVTDKSGTRYTFGSTSSSRQDNASSTADVYQWLVSEIRDTNNNFVKYTYFKSGGQIYPDTITYTGSGVTDGIYTVQYLRELRSDAMRSYSPKFQVDTTFRIDKIRISVNGSGVREYDLSYVAGNNGYRSILSSVTESGMEGSSTTTLPATTFAYSTSTNNWAEAASSTIPEPFVLNDYSFAGTYLVDVNGDSLQDIIRSYASSTGSTQKVYLNKGGYWNYDASWSIPIIFHTSTTSKGVSLVDVNGDSITDLVQSYRESGVESKKVWIGNGSGWTYDASWVVPELFYDGSQDYGARFADVNADGLVDILAKRTNGSGSVVLDKVYLNTGSGWVHDVSWSIPEAFIISSTSDSGARLADLNGDGLTDIVINRTGSINVNKAYLNTGTGWIENTSWQLPVPILWNDTNDYGTRLADINADGLVDIIQKRIDQNNTHIMGVYLNTGSGWVQKMNWYLPVTFVYNNTGDSGARLTDLDGDGVVDVILSNQLTYAGAGTVYIERTTGIFMGADETSDLITRKIDQMGGTTNFSYQGSSRYRTSGGLSLNPTLPIGFQTVGTTTYNSNFGNIWSESYIYSDGRMYFATTTPRDRKFAGFGKIEQLRNGSRSTSYQHQGNGNDVASAEVADGYHKIGFTYRVDKSDSAGTLYRINRTNWATTTLSTTSAFVKNTSEVNLDYDGDSDHKDSAISYTYNDTYGNISLNTQWGEVLANIDGTFSDTGLDKRTVSYTYATNTSAYIVGLPQTERLDNSVGAKVRETRFYYDALSLGSTTKGNITKREDWATSTIYSSTQWSYNSYGLKTSETDPRNNVTNFVYDTYNLYPATSTNALSQSSKFTYDYSSGLVKTLTDPNGFIHEKVYDTLDRVIETKEPNGSADALVTIETNAYINTSNAVRVLNTRYLDNGTTTEAYAYLDGFGRQVQVRQEDEETGQFIVKDTVYGKDGMLHKESLPYFQAGSARTSPTNTSTLYTNYAYDVLDRRNGVGTVLGTTTIGYDQWIETATNTLSHSKSYGYDAFGRLGSVVERNGASAYTTTYDWTAHDRLGTTTDSLANIRRFEYDGLGNRVKAEDLHAPADSTFGVWQYQYDAASNLSTSTDPKNQIVVRTYDALNRSLTENFTGQTGIEFSSAYDSCVNGKGKICSITSATSTTNYTYHGSGAERSAARTIAGTTYTSTTTYDYLLNPKLITHPNFSETQYIYDTAGKLTRVNTRGQGGQFTAFINDIDYGPHGLVTYEEHSNGVYTQNTYDPLELYRLKRKLTNRFGTGGNPELTAEEENLSVLDTIVDTTGSLITNFVSAIKDVFTSSSSEAIATSSSPIDKEDNLLTPPLDINVEPEVNIVQKDTLINEEPLKKPAAAQKIKPIIFDDGVDAEGNKKKRMRMFAGLVEPTNRKVEVVTNEQKIDVVHGWSSVRLEKDNAKPLFSFLGRNNLPIAVTVVEDTLSSTTQIKNREITDEGDGKFSIKNALSTGDAIEMTVGEQVIAKQVVLAKEPSGSGENYDVSFLLSHSDNLDLKFGNTILSETKSITTNEAVALLSGEEEIAVIHPPRATDVELASHLIPYVNISVTYEYRDGDILATKHIPRTWLKRATYPVKADLTFSTYGGSGDGTLDGQPSTNWDVVHDSTSGVYIDYSTPEILALSRIAFDGINYDIYRGFLLFDTSAIPDTAIITAATTSVYVAGIHNQDNDASAYMGLYQSQQATTSKILADDINKCGSVNNPTLGAPIVDIDNIFLNNYLRLPHNATGTGWISKTGFTRLCMREGHDSDDIAITGSAYYYSGIRINSSDTAGTLTDPFIEIAYTEYTPVAPLAPTNQRTDNLFNPTTLTTTAPNFTAIFTDSNSLDTGTAWNIQLSASSTSWSNLVWDSGTTTYVVPISSGATTSNMTYSGSTTLVNNTPYYWRVKFLDSENTWSPWSTSTASFMLVNNATSSSSNIQDLIYTYDKVGNIISISDARTATPPVTVYQYDNLYRLISVGTTTGTRTYSGNTPIITFSNPVPYRQWTYNAIGNITSSTNNGVYTYAGTGYANPHAPTQIGSSTITYDQNGNRLTLGSATYTWNYKNELFKVASGTASTTFSYDHLGARTIKQSASTTIRYINPSYEDTPGASSTRHIYANGMLMGTEVGNTQTHIHRDHLESTNVVTDPSGTPTHTLTYHPYGNIQSETLSGTSANTIFSDSINPLWNSTSWSISTSSATSPVYEGTTSLRVSYATAWGGLSYKQSINTTSYTTLSLSLNIGTSSIPALYLYATNASGTNLTIKHLNSYIPGGIQQNTWHTVSIPLSDLGIQNYIGNLTLNLESSLAIPIYLDAYSFKAIQTGERNQFIGQDFDAETQLSYLNARYYEGSRGQFLSQDPAHLAIGDPLFEDMYDRPLMFHLSNPQSLNSYSYALNNPLKYKDPGGDIVPFVLFAVWASAELGLSLYDAHIVYKTLNDPNATDLEKNIVLAGFGAGIVGPGGGYGSAGKNIASSVSTLKVSSVGQFLLKEADSSKLKNIIGNLYRPGAKIGDGGTAAAIRYEIQTGRLVGGKSHIKKGQESIRALEKLLNDKSLSKSDRKVAEKLKNDLEKSLQTKPKTNK